MHDIASLQGHLDVVRELLARGASTEAANWFGDTPLTASSHVGHIEVVRALLAAGADKRHVASNGDTAASLVGRYTHSIAGSGASRAILALLAAAP